MYAVIHNHQDVAPDLTERVSQRFRRIDRATTAARHVTTRLAAVLLLALASMLSLSLGTASAATPPAGLTATEVTQTVSAHNAVRQRVATSESARLHRTVKIPNLVWDANVAAYAQAWANQQATLMKQGQPSPKHRPNNPYGENWYFAWSTPTAPNPAPTAPVNAWAAEQPYYNYATNTCTNTTYGCFHFTQVVWAATTRVGCGRAVWAVGTKQYVLWVCNYSPKGNILGQRPY